MTVSLWLSLLGASALISFTPGAGAINTMTNSLNAGFRRSIWGIFGQQAALVAHVAIVAAGVGLLVSGSPVAFTAIRFAGAAYLVFLGVRLFLAKPSPAAPEHEAVGGLARNEAGWSESGWSMFRRGLWVNLLNPKAIVFFLAFTPQFVHPEEPLLPQYAVLIATVVAVDILVMWFFFAAAAKSVRRFTRGTRGQLVLNRTFGTLFILVAALLAFVH
ncbi:homoserine/homoserine lactone efflux protein [Arthrobacter ginkgonis]|uniref:Homoserine/homoserine lactone efflux protein n=1 Tax=Arthrobacter ginkgonis TaxID=1630594 RepID=A0ABP7C406_9MICC